MDRTDELLRATQLFSSIDFSKSGSRVIEPSSFILCAGKVSSYLDGNETLVRRMNKLIEKKEFSNDPTVELQQISSSFEGNMLTVRNDVTKLKNQIKINGQGVQSGKHRELIVENLQSILGAHINAFKNAHKVHGENIEQRNKRVGGKYGQAAAVSALSSESASKYAMFNSSSANSDDTPLLSRQQELRNRRGGSHLTQHQYTSEVVPDSSEGPPSSQNNNSQVGAANAEDNYENDKKYGKRAAAPTSGSGNSNLNLRGAAGRTSTGTGSAPSSGGNVMRPVGGLGVGQSQGQVQQRQGKQDRYSLHQAKQAESTVARMGEMFVQMVTLVRDQEDTLARIEDDVEAGLAETLEAQGHLQTVHDITKGNRSLILKIFLLLIFFIFLFLVWF